MSMKERLARALAALDLEKAAEGVPILVSHGDLEAAKERSLARLWPQYIPQVEAILQALREPSVEMLVAALPNVEEPTDADKRLAAGAFNVLSPDRTDRAWQAITAGSELARDWRNMIDHIINEGK